MNVFENRGGKDRLRLVCFSGILLRVMVRPLTKKIVRKNTFYATSPTSQVGEGAAIVIFLPVTFLFDSAIVN